MNFKLIIDRKKEEAVVITAHDRSALTDRIEAMVREYGGNHRIAVWDEDDWKMLSFEEIECITVADGKTWAIDTRGKHFRIKQRLYEVEAILPSYFIRINKSAIANEARLERFSPSFSGAVDAIFKCGYREYVSRRCLAEIKRRFEKL